VIESQESASLEFEQSQISLTAFPLLPPPLLERVPALKISANNDESSDIAIFAECSINQVYLTHLIKAK
jgi:hypothetical protein